MPSTWQSLAFFEWGYSEPPTDNNLISPSISLARWPHGLDTNFCLQSCCIIFRQHGLKVALPRNFWDLVLLSYLVQDTTIYIIWSESCWSYLYLAVLKELEKLHRKLLKVRGSGIHLKSMLSFSKERQWLFFSLSKSGSGKSSLEECLLNNTIIYGLLTLQCKPYTEVISQYIDPDRKAGLCTPLLLPSYFIPSNYNFPLGTANIF